MAAYITFYFLFSIHLFVALTSPVSQHSTDLHQELINSLINRASPPTSATKDGPLKIHIPQFLSFGIKYHFAVSWNVINGVRKGLSFCNEKENVIIRKCGIARLYDAIDNRNIPGKKPVTIGEDFNKALTKQCGYYDQFKQCLEKFYLLNCFADDKTVVDILYSYACGLGKGVLTSSNTGQCLTTLSMSSIITEVQKKAGCNNVFSDLSSSVQVMFSQLHNHYSKISYEIPAMRENLAVLCRTWYIEETCIIPTYAEKCGEAASIFYVGLLNYTKKALADEYHQYGSDMSRLALCSRSVVKKLMKGQLKHQADAGFNGYITKQYRSWKATEDYYELNFGTCDIMSTYYRLISCFWQSIYDFKQEIVQMISDLVNHREDVTRSIQDFSRCYDEYIEDCPPENKISFVNFFQSLRIIINNTGDGSDCIDAFNLFHICEEKCGLRLEELIEYYFFQASKFYDTAVYKCSVDLSRFKVDFSCLIQHFDDMAYNVSNPLTKPLCHHHLVADLRRFVTNLEEVINDYITLIKRVRVLKCRVT